MMIRYYCTWLTDVQLIYIIQRRFLINLMIYLRQEHWLLLVNSVIHANELKDGVSLNVVDDWIKDSEILEEYYNLYISRLK